MRSVSVISRGSEPVVCLQAAAVGTSQRLVPTAAMAALVGLLVLAWMVARGETPPMTISPDRAAPGETVTVRFEEPHYLDAALTLERDGRTFLLQNDRLTELDDLAGADPPSERSALLEDNRPSDDYVSAGGPLTSLSSLPDGYSLVISYDPVPKSSTWSVILPYELERGTYRVCTWAAYHGVRACAPLTIAFG
jgi:hypothetical protein